MMTSEPSIMPVLEPVEARLLLSADPIVTEPFAMLESSVSGDAVIVDADLADPSSDGVLNASDDNDLAVESVAATTVGYTTVFPNISTVTNRRAQPVVAGHTGNLESISIYHQGAAVVQFWGCTRMHRDCRGPCWA